MAEVFWAVSDAADGAAGEAADWQLVEHLGGGAGGVAAGGSVA